MSDLISRALAAATERARGSTRTHLRARGVVPTPSVLARLGVARVDQLLRSELGIEQGLASERVAILDPAVGTGVWLAAVLEHTRTRGAKAHLLGFDTDQATIDAAAALLAPEAATQGACLSLSCANTLELAAPFPDSDRVRVIVGNPPWAARSLSRGGALSDAWLSEFRLDHEGAALSERRVGVLSDDYVRFFRWALEQARTTEHGAVVCLATNASFLDGPVHRGMRSALLKAFDQLELLDLGGNSLLSRARDGSRQRDDNLFGVRVGAAISWAWRSARPSATPRAATSVSFAQLRGSLADKLVALERATPSSTRHTPSAPWFHFRPGVAATAQPGFSLAEAFPFQREGVQTNRDAVAIALSYAELEQRLHEFVRGDLSVPALRHFDPARARTLLSAARERGESCIAKLSYRPLDDRFFVTLPPLCHRPRAELQAAMSHSSLCLLAVRKDRGAAQFNLFGAAQHTADACFLSTRSSCRTRVFPSHQPDGSPNLSAGVQAQLGERIGRAPSSVEVIEYALSVLGSPRHRCEQQAALQLDYAHLPWPRDASHFERAVQLGQSFVTALSAERAPTGQDLVCTPGIDLEGPLGELRYEAAAGTLSSGGRVLLHGVQPAWWTAQVGHHGFVASVLRTGAPIKLARVIDALNRAAAWVAAEGAADALLFEGR
ncbi:MAG: putative helicase [Myxococcaceae bacterium]|nr:putative helicase [Myxococcaceae bacterium]